MKPKFRKLPAVFSPFRRATFVICASLCAAASHADQTWTGASSALWSNTANWNTTLPAADENAVFGAASTANLTIDTAANQAVGGILLTSPAGPVTINNNTLTLGSGGIDMSAATQNLTLGSNFAAADGTAQDWRIGSGRLLTLGGTLASGAGAIRIDTSAGGAVQISSGTALDLLPSRGFTLNNSDFAGLDGSKNVVAGKTLSGLGLVTYVDNTNSGAALPNMAGTVDLIDVVNSNTNATNAIRLSNSLTCYRGVRFSTPHATGMNWVSDLSSSRNCAMNPGAGILVGSNINTDVIWNGSGTIRTFGGGTHDLYLTNLSSNNLIFNVGFSVSSGRTWRLVKSGPGKVVFGGTAAAVAGGLWVNEGTVQIGNGGAGGAVEGACNLAEGTTLAFNRSDAALVQANAISGDGQVTMVGGGVVTLAGANTYTGGTTVTSGLLGASSSGNFGTGEVLLNGGGVRFAGVFDLTDLIVTIGSAGAVLDTNGNNINLFNAFEPGSTGGLTKIGAGSLSLEGDNDYTGGTTVNAGTLLANAFGSSTGSGTVTVNSGATLGGEGVIEGTAHLTSGSILAPGNSVGELIVGALDLDAGSTGVFEFSTAPDNDHVLVADNGGLTIDGGAITLVQEGTSAPFATPGTYDLISYSGAIGGAGVSSLSVANPQAGFSYQFDDAGGEVTLTITALGVVSHWETDGGGLWTDGGNWSSTIPNGAGATAIFDTELTNPAIVDLNGAKTVGAMTFTSANSYILSQGASGPLTLNSGTGDPVLVSVNNGAHEVAADVALVSDLTVSPVGADDSLTLSGDISGAGGLTKNSAGSLSLLGSNTFAGDVSLEAGATTFANGGLGVGDLFVNNSALAWASGNTQDISNRNVAFGDDVVTFDTNGNNVTLANSFGDLGLADFTKLGAGTLALGDDATFLGDVTIAAGTLQLGTGGTAGLVDGDIINQGTLAVSRSDDFLLGNLISGAGNLVQAGPGDVMLTSANTFSGTTSITAGTLTLAHSLAIQNSTLEYDSAGGSIGFDVLTAVTLGGLSGDKDLDLVNSDLSPAPIALTVGGNGASTTFEGVLGGAGASLIKAGAGTLTLTGTNTYDNSTHVNAGTLEITGTIVNNTITTGDNGILRVAGGTITASAFSDVTNDLIIDLGGEANYNGGLRGDNLDNSLFHVLDGTLNATSVEIRRSGNYGSNPAGPSFAPGGAPATGFVVGSAGTANVGDLSIGTENSGGIAVIDGGIADVSGTVTLGNTSNDRWTVLDARSGELQITDTTLGVVLAPRGDLANKAAFYASGAICNVGRFTFGEASSAEGYGLVHITGELYVGSGGMVQAAPAFNSTVKITGGILGAYENWSTSIPVTLDGGSIATISAQDYDFNPFDIQLAGGITGSADLAKEGEGTLTVADTSTYTGNIEVLEGTLRLTSATLDDASTILVDEGFGAVLNLDFTGGDRVAVFEIDGDAQPDGIYGAVGSGAPNETPAITGTGWLYVNTAVPASGYVSWASDAGLTAGNNGPTDDAEPDGIENLLEFVLGGDPLASDPEILPDVDASGANYVFTFTRSSSSMPEVTLTFQHGNSLVGWTDVAIGADTASSGPGVTITPGAGEDAVQVTVPKAGNTKLFGRLRAVR